ncbi:9026_t:CDS:2 [Entrophospora sp. SA101]|nr:9026_t:CDS:2 [Entrophospora sp. SA101]CAJ0883000.1 1966_t:CDS:2 [Entrophospora sp. SA101]
MNDKIFDLVEEELKSLKTKFNAFEQNFENIKSISDSLNEFNSFFASFLYGMKMNTHCIEFPEASEGHLSNRNTQ